MPTIDIPLQELEVYQGCNPKPKDFESYWDQGIAEMQKLVGDYTLTTADFQVPGVECFDLYFKGVGGSIVYAKYARPAKREGKIPAIVNFHGYTGDSGDWFGTLAYVAAGFAVAYMDCRGQAGKSEDLSAVRGNTYHGHIVRGLDASPEDLLFRQIFLDTAQLANIVMNFDEVDEGAVASAGSSQGGGLAVACAALEPKIARTAPQVPFLSDYKRVWNMDLDKGAYQEIRDYFRRRDPLHEREEEIFTTLGYIDIQHLAPRIRGKVLWCVGLMDEICPPSTQYAAYNKITTPKEILVYPDFSHEGMRGFNDRALLFLSEMQK